MLKRYIPNLKNFDVTDIKAFAIYLVTNVFIFLLPLAVTPIIARYLSTEEFGIWAIYMLLSTYFVQLVRFELHLVTKRVYKLRPKTLPSVMFLSSLTIFILGIILALVMAVGYQAIVSLLGDNVYLVWIALTGSMLKSFAILAHGYMQISGNVKEYSLVNIVSSYLLYSLVIFLVVRMGLGIDGRVYADIIITSIIAIHAAWYLRRKGLIKINFRVSMFKENIKEAWSPFIFSVFVISLANFDKILIGWFFDKSKLGTFVVALQFASVMTVVTSSLSPVIEKFFYNSKSDIGFSKTALVTISVAGIICTVILSELISLAIFILMPQEFYEATKYSLVASLSVLASFIVAMGVSFVNSISEVRKILLPFAVLVAFSFSSGFVLFSLSASPEHLAFIYILTMFLFVKMIYNEYEKSQ